MVMSEEVVETMKEVAHRCVRSASSHLDDNFKHFARASCYVSLNCFL